MRTTNSNDEIEFEVTIDEKGGVSAEYPREHEEQVRAFLNRGARPPERGRSPRVLPRADEILTPEEAAEHLGIPKKTVIFLCAEGRLDGAFKAGRRWRVPGRAVRKMAGVP